MLKSWGNDNKACQRKVLCIVLSVLAEVAELDWREE